MVADGLDHNDGHPPSVLSTGERLAVALVLRDVEHLEAMNYRLNEAAQRAIAGMYEPPRDLIAWLKAIRAELSRRNPR